VNEKGRKAKKKCVVFNFDFGLLQIGEVVGVSFINLCLEGKYKKKNLMRNVFRKTEYLS
jgi:hypothetical protein